MFKPPKTSSKALAYQKCGNGRVNPPNAKSAQKQLSQNPLDRNRAEDVHQRGHGVPGGGVHLVRDEAGALPPLHVRHRHREHQDRVRSRP